MKLYLTFVLVITFAINVAAQNNQPTVAYGGTGQARRVIEMSNMLGEVDGVECLRSRSYTGTIVRRTFDEEETMITGITLRDARDNRIHLNINESHIWGLGRTAPSILSSLLARGRRVRIWTYECSGGGSGVFIYADRVRAL